MATIEQSVTGGLSERSFLDEVRAELGIIDFKVPPLAVTSSRPSAINGTTATTSSRLPRAKSSASSATRRLTRSSPAPELSGIRSPAKNSAAAQ